MLAWSWTIRSPGVACVAARNGPCRRVRVARRIVAGLLLLGCGTPRAELAGDKRAGGHLRLPPRKGSWTPDDLGPFWTLCNRVVEANLGEFGRNWLMCYLSKKVSMNTYFFMNYSLPIFMQLL